MVGQPPLQPYGGGAMAQWLVHWGPLLSMESLHWVCFLIVLLLSQMYKWILATMSCSKAANPGIFLLYFFLSRNTFHCLWLCSLIKLKTE